MILPSIGKNQPDDNPLSSPRSPLLSPFRDDTLLLKFVLLTLSAEAFVIGARAYQMELYRPALVSFTPADVFLDVNAQWSTDELERLIRLPRS